MANEIMNFWRLNAELVTLSSCESGLGRSAAAGSEQQGLLKAKEPLAIRYA